MKVTKQMKEKLNSNNYETIIIKKINGEYTIKVMGKSFYKDPGFYESIKDKSDIDQIKEIISYYMFNNNPNVIDRQDKNIILQSKSGCKLKLVNLDDKGILEFILTNYYEKCFRNIPNDVKTIVFTESYGDMKFNVYQNAAIYELSYLNDAYEDINMDTIVNYYINNRKNGNIMYPSNEWIFRKLISGTEEDLDDINDEELLTDFQFKVDDITFCVPDYKAYEYLPMIDEENKKYKEEKSKQFTLGGIK